MSNWKPKDFAKYTLYRIYYGNTLVYLGRTTQPFPVVLFLCLYAITF